LASPSTLLSESPPQSVSAVIARMESILSPLTAADGIACFTRLYLAVTRGMQERLAGVVFGDPAFLARLDERRGAVGATA
jgi:predicted anti-sigma-YlaC factor YlaD